MCVHMDLLCELGFPSTPNNVIRLEQQGKTDTTLLNYIVVPL